MQTAVIPKAVPKQERTEVVLLCFVDQIAKALLKRNKPRTTRYNRLQALRQDGNWHCTLKGFEQVIPKELRLTGCSHYEVF